MNFLALFFIISTFYYLFNKSHLEKRVDQKLIMYDNKRWILFDIIYYIHQILYWIWLFILLFTQWKIFAILLLIISLGNSISIWLFNNNSYNFFDGPSSGHLICVPFMVRESAQGLNNSTQQCLCIIQMRSVLLHVFAAMR